MKVSVYDTYVPKDESTTMHFDILVEEDTPEEKVYQFGKQYLKSKKLENLPLTQKECKYCHIEKVSHDVEEVINMNGFHIIEMENC